MKKQVIVLLTLFTLSVAACKSQKETSTSERESTEKRPGKNQGQPDIDKIFEMDVDNDGKLSRTEVKGRLLERFSEIDTDGDGFITKIEMQNAPRPQKGGKGGGRPPRN